MNRNEKNLNNIQGYNINISNNLESQIGQSNFYFKNKKINQTVLKLEMKDTKILNHLKYEFIFICDCSGSMYEYANDIITKVIPNVLEKLNYNNNKSMHLIIFNKEVEYKKVKIKNLKNIKINVGGGTHMSKIFEELKKILSQIKPENIINILTLSDGMICDEKETQKEAENLYKIVNGKFPNINSQAIRFFSEPGAEPDTRALCSLIKFGNINIKKKGENLFEEFDPKGILDENKIEELTHIIARLYYKKMSGWRIVSKEKKLRVEPNGPSFYQIELPVGKNIFFYDGIFENMEDIPSICSDDGSQQNISKGEDVFQDNYLSIYEENFGIMIKDNIMDKIIGGEEGEKKIEDRIKYLKTLEEKINDNNIIKSKKISEIMEEIKNDKSIINLSGDKLNNYINIKKKECEKEIEEIIREEKEIKSNKINQHLQFIILIDSSEYMRNSLNYLVKNILYSVALKLGFKLEHKIRILGFNSKDVDEKNIQIRKLNNLKILCEGKRKLFKALNNAGEIMIKSPKLHYYLLTIISGEIKDKNNLRSLAYKILRLKDKVKIKSRIMKYINKESDFPKNIKGEIDELQEDYISYGLIRQLDSSGMTNVKPLEIYESESDEEKIRKIVEIFKNK